MCHTTEGSKPLTVLRECLRPFQALNTAWGQKLLTSTGRAGWLHCATHLYYVLKATDPLLQFAVEAAEKRSEDLQAFIAWARHHADEEREHYRWYRDDLRTMGIDPDKVEQQPPDPHILRLINAQFALMEVRHPVALLGFFYATECHTPDAENLRACARQFAIPEASLHTMLFHASADQQHRLEILDLVARCAQKPAYGDAMLASAIEVLTGWTLFFKDAAESLDKVA